MKKIVFGIICVLFIAGACTRSCCRDEPAEEVLRIGTNANFPPYETRDESGKLVGFDIDIGRKLADSLGLKPEFREFDFDALVLALDKGQIDIILSGMSITESRQKEIAMIPYAGDPMSEISLIFWRELPTGINSLADLKLHVEKARSTVSVQAGHFLEQFLRDEGIPVKGLSGPPEQIIDIKYGKSIAAALDGPNAKNLSRDHADLKLLTLSLPKDKWDLGYGIGIKKSRVDLIERIGRAVTELRSDGSIDSLKKRWFKDEL